MVMIVRWVADVEERPEWIEEVVHRINVLQRGETKGRRKGKKLRGSENNWYS